MRDFWPIVSVQIHSNHRAMGADKCALLYLDIDRLTTISMPATNKSAIDGQDTIVNIIAARGAPNYRNYGANKRRRERLAALFLVSEQSGGSMAGDPEAWGVKQGVLAWGTTRTCSVPCTWCRLICNGQSHTGPYSVLCEYEYDYLIVSYAPMVIMKWTTSPNLPLKNHLRRKCLHLTTWNY